MIPHLFKIKIVELFIMANSVCISTENNIKKKKKNRNFEIYMGEQVSNKSDLATTDCNFDSAVLVTVKRGTK